MLSLNTAILGSKHSRTQILSNIAAATNTAARRALATNTNDGRSSSIVGKKQKLSSTTPAATKSTPTTPSPTKARRIVTSARILPDGIVRPALYNESTPIPRCEPYPMTHYAGLFPWLLSVERQREPVDGLGVLGINNMRTPSLLKMSLLRTFGLDGIFARSQQNSQAQCNRNVNGTGASDVAGDDGNAFVAISSSSSSLSSSPSLSSMLMQAVILGSTAMISGWMPRSINEQISASLNAHIAQRTLGVNALDDVVAGAKLVLPHITQALSTSSDSSGLKRMLSTPLHKRFVSELGKLANDNVELSIEVNKVNDASIRRVRTQVGPTEAFTSCSSHPLTAHHSTTASSLRSGVARHAHRLSGIFGVSHAMPTTADASSTSSIHRVLEDALSGDVPVCVRVDVEINAAMRYRLIGKRKAQSGYDHDSGSEKTIVDDKATRNIVLTLESTPVCANLSSGTNSRAMLQWSVSDIDYLLSSEQRIYDELNPDTNTDSTSQ